MAESDYINFYKSTFNYSNPNPVGKIGTGFYRTWEIGVSVPVPNPHFNYQKKLRYAINTNTLGAGYIGIGAGSTEAATKIANIIKAGWSRLSKADGSLSEIVEILQASVNVAEVVIDWKVAPTNSFVPGDIFEYYSPVNADQWASESSLLVPATMLKEYPADLGDIDGKLYAQQLQIVSTNYNSTVRLFQAALPTDIHRYLNSSYNYRIGARYKMGWGSDTTSRGEVSIKVTTNTVPKKLILNYFPTQYADKFWLHNSDKFTDFLAEATIRASAQYMQIAVTNADATASVGTYKFSFEDIYWEHSAGVESLMGCLLLPNAPLRDSLSIDVLEGEFEDLIVSNNNRYPYFPRGNPNITRKHKISGTFDSVTNSQYQKLKIMERFQNDGFLINIHPHLSEVGQHLTGTLRIGAKRKNIFDMSRVSFDFEFVEA